jgi:peptidyl-prolyl cis-trans isomerase C
MKNNAIRWSILWVLVALACTPKEQKPAVELVAKVNGEGITKPDFEDHVKKNMARYQGQGHTLPPGIEPRIRESVLRRMVDNVVIAQKAKTLQVEIKAEELSKKFEDHKSRFRSQEAFDAYLKRSNNTEANMKNELKRNMLRDRVVEKMSGETAVAEEAVQKYYDENKDRFAVKEQVRASRILFRFKAAPNADAALKKKDDIETKARAMKVRAIFKKKSDSDFSALAKEHSDGPEKDRRGELGWLSRGRMPQEFDALAFALEANQVSDLLKTREGYQIVKVLEKKPGKQRGLEEVEENIRNSLLARKRNENRRNVLKELKKDAKVEYLISFAPPPRPKLAPKSPIPRGAAAHPATALQPGQRALPKPPGSPTHPQGDGHSHGDGHAHDDGHGH